MIDVPNDTRREVGEFVEGRPSRQLAVQAVHHVDLANVMFVLSAVDRFGGPRFLRLWDRFAALTYRDQETGDPGADDVNLLRRSLSGPGGTLACALVDALGALEPDADSGLGTELKPRFDKIAVANGRSSLLAPAYLGHVLPYLDWVDPEWTKEKLISKFSWEHPEALAMWRSFSRGTIGSARLLNTLKPAMLHTFERWDLFDDELEG
jgi:hypothetical protein